MKDKRNGFLAKRRFTLLELLTVIVIMAILMAVALKIGTQNPVKNNARTVGSYIRLAQAKAISSNIDVAAIISQDEEGFPQIGVYRWAYDNDELSKMWVSSGDADYRVWTDASENYVRRHLLMPGTSFRKFNGHVKFSTKSGSDFEVSNSSSKFLIFKFNERGVLEDVSNSASNEINILDENSEAEMTVSVDVFSGKVNYDKDS